MGLSPKPERPSHGVASYLQRAGYTIVPVRPTGTIILGEPVQPNLRAAAATGPIDIVNVFRRSEFVPGLLDDLLAVRPRLVWLQVGVRHEPTARTARGRRDRGRDGPLPGGGSPIPGGLMRVRQAAAAFALLATLWSPLAAQRTRDRPTLVFTVSGAYLDGTGLWTVPDQHMDIGGPLPPDHFFLNRSIKRTLGASFSATYYKGQHFGLTGEAFLIGLGYDDACQHPRHAQLHRQHRALSVHR